MRRPCAGLCAVAHLISIPIALTHASAHVMCHVLRVSCCKTADFSHSARHGQGPARVHPGATTLTPPPLGGHCNALLCIIGAHRVPLMHHLHRNPRDALHKWWDMNAIGQEGTHARRARPNAMAVQPSSLPSSQPHSCSSSTQLHSPKPSTEAGMAAVWSRPTPLVQAAVNDQKLTEPTPSVACTRVLLTRYTVHGTCGKTWCTVLKTKGQDTRQRPSCPNQLP